MIYIYIYNYKKICLTANSSQLEKKNMSKFVFLISTLPVLQKVSLLNNIVNNKKYLYGRNIDHKLLLLLFNYCFY